MGLHHQQHQTVHQGAQTGIDLQGTARRWGADVEATGFEGPEVGRVNAFGARDLLDIPVLSKQGDRMHRLVAEHQFQVLHQRKARLLHLGGRLFGTGLRLLHKPVDRRLHGAQHLCGRCQAHHLQGAYRLVQLLASHPQRSRIDRLKVIATRLVGLPDKTTNRLVRAFKGLAQLVEHPGQRTKVGERSFRLQTAWCGIEHDEALSVHVRTRTVEIRRS